MRFRLKKAKSLLTFLLHYVNQQALYKSICVGKTFYEIMAAQVGEQYRLIGLREETWWQI
jgi:hypothetical protein